LNTSTPHETNTIVINTRTRNGFSSKNDCEAFASIYDRLALHNRLINNVFHYSGLIIRWCSINCFIQLSAIWIYHIRRYGYFSCEWSVCTNQCFNRTQWSWWSINISNAILLGLYYIVCIFTIIVNPVALNIHIAYWGYKRNYSNRNEICFIDLYIWCSVIFTCSRNTIVIERSKQSNGWNVLLVCWSNNEFRLKLSFYIRF
jgi:hypothetical protein